MPPGGNGTTSLMGFSGYLACAKTGPAASGSAEAPSTKLRRVVIVSSPSCRWSGW
jgi:hypothetical protein